MSVVDRPRALVDTNVPMYAGGVDHPLREPSRRVVLAIVGGTIDVVTDSEVPQEILYRYLRTRDVREIWSA